MSLILLVLAGFPGMFFILWKAHVREASSNMQYLLRSGSELSHYHPYSFGQKQVERSKPNVCGVQKQSVSNERSYKTTFQRARMEQWKIRNTNVIYHCFFLGLSSLLPTDGRGDTFLLMLAANRNDLPQQVRPVPNYRNQALLLHAP